MAEQPGLPSEGKSQLPPQPPAMEQGQAGDFQDSKSTTGVMLCLVGPNTFCPISWLCKKQGAVSHSSTEAEIVALDAALRMEGIPCLDLLSHIQMIMTPSAFKQKIQPKTMQSAIPQNDPVLEVIQNVSSPSRPSCQLSRPTAISTILS